MTPRYAGFILAGAVASSLLFVAPESQPQEPTAASAAAGTPLDAEQLLARGELRTQLDDLDAAEADFLDAIELITATDGEFAAALIRAYRGLARVLAARGDLPEAITTLESARHVSHRNFGLFNMEQAEILDELSGVYEQAGDTREAQQQQQEILDVAQRHFGADAADVIPYHFKLARYYELERMRGLARDQYARALEIVRDDPQSTPADELPMLTELVRIATLTGEASRARRDLEDLLRSDVTAAAAIEAEAYAVLGDDELVNGRLDGAAEFYAQAHAVFAIPDEGDAYFRAPRLINFVPPPSPVDWGRRRGGDYAWGAITAAFGLTATGKAERIAIVVSDPPGLMDALYARRLAEAVFRPRIEGGHMVATNRLRFSHEFRYFLPDEE